MTKAPDTMPVENLAEVLCNIDGLDSTSPTHWGNALRIAQQMKDEVAAGQMEPWWSEDVVDRLEYLRGEINAERISYGELIELQGYADHIDRGDVQLLEWAGVPEFPEDSEFAPYGACGVLGCTDCT